MMVMWSIVALMVICLVYSIYLRRGETLEEYTSNRGKTGPWHVAMTILATCVGGWMFFGVTAIGYEAGVVGYFLGLIYCLGLVLLGAVVPAIAEVMRESNCDTLDDFLFARMGRRVQVAAAIVNGVVFLAFLASQFMALGDFLRVFSGMGLEVAVWLGAAIVITYTAVSGFKGVLKTDFFQFAIVFGIAVFMTWHLAQKVSINQVQALPSDMFTGLGYGPQFLFGAFLFLTPSFLVRSDLWQRIASAENNRSARHGFFLAAPLMLIAYTLFTTIGIAARAALGAGQNPGMASLEWFRATTQSQTILFLVSLAIFFAVLSTADSYLNIVATGLVKALKRTEWDAYEANKSKEQSDKLMRWISGVTVMVGILGIGMWKLLPNIVDLILGSVSGLLILSPALFLAFRDHRNRDTVALTSIVVGAVTVVGFLILGKNPKIAFVPGVLASALACGIGCIIVKAPPTTSKNKTAADQG